MDAPGVDEADFDRLVAPYRARSQAHCYRMGTTPRICPVAGTGTDCRRVAEFAA